jgi:hypothetical protein
MVSSCPICGCGPLRPVFTGKVVYTLASDQPSPIGKFHAYSCGLNGHILMIPQEGNGISYPVEIKPPLATSERGRILNSWKEIASHLGRGVRTVQRWERELGLPVHRPRGTSRSPVTAMAKDLEEWLHRSSVHLTDASGIGHGSRTDSAGAATRSPKSVEENEST